MTTRRWVLPLPITAGFILAFALFAVAGLSALYDQTHPIPFNDPAGINALPAPERRIYEQLLAERAQRRERGIPRNLVVTVLGTMMAALTLIVLNRQTRARRASEE